MSTLEVCLTYMKKLIHRSITPLGGIISAFILLIGVAILLVANHVSALGASQQDGRLVTIHDRGIQSIILTKAATIGDALQEAGVSLDQSDAIEPALTEKLVASDYQVNIYRARPVIVVDGTTKQKVVTPYQTGARIAKDAGITLYDEDKTTLTRTDDIVSEGAGLRLTITRAIPFTFTLYGATTEARTQAKTVGDMLQEKGITLSKDDRVSVPVSTEMTSGLAVRVWREGKQTVTVDEEVAFSTDTIQDGDQYIGYRVIKTPGQNGSRSVTYEVIIQDGKEVGRTEIASLMIKEPKKQIEIVGAKLTNTFSGSFGEALARLRSCEGSYTSNTGNGYYGAYQYDIQTWGGYQGYPNAAVAPPAVQDQKVWETYQRRGWNPWPSCSRSLGLQDTYR